MTWRTRAAGLLFGLFVLAMAAGMLQSAGASTTLWSAERAGHHVECRTRLVSEGVEVQLLSNGRCVYSRTFTDGEDALQFAESQRTPG